MLAAVAREAVAGRDDRFSPFAFQQRFAGGRLGAETRPLPGGHLTPLSQPDAVAGALIARSRVADDDVGQERSMPGSHLG